MTLPFLPTGPDREIVYIKSHFPNLTETFVYRQLIAARNLGRRVSLLALLKPNAMIPSEEFSSLKTLPIRYYSLFSCFLATCMNLISHPGKSLGIFSEIFITCWKRPLILMKMFFCYVKANGFIFYNTSGSSIILHAHFCHLEAACAYFINRLSGIPYTVINHVIIFYLPQKLTRSILENALLVVCDFEWNRNELIRIFPTVSKNAVTIRGGLFHSNSLPKYRPTGQIPMILNIGRLRKTKGQAYLLEACEILKKKGIQFRCEIVGEGDQRQSLMKMLLELDLSDFVVLRGKCAWNDLEDFYRKADVFAFPCIMDQIGRADGVPTVLLEAMGRGIPLVVSSLPGAGEVVRNGECGSVVPERNSKALADALERVLFNEELRKQYFQKGLIHLRNEFDIEKNVAFLLQLEKERIFKKGQSKTFKRNG